MVPSHILSQNINIRSLTVPTSNWHTQHIPPSHTSGYMFAQAAGSGLPDQDPPDMCAPPMVIEPPPEVIYPHSEVIDPHSELVDPPPKGMDPPPEVTDPAMVDLDGVGSDQEALAADSLSPAHNQVARHANPEHADQGALCANQGPLHANQGVPDTNQEALHATEAQQAKPKLMIPAFRRRPRALPVRTTPRCLDHHGHLEGSTNPAGPTDLHPSPYEAAEDTIEEEELGNGDFIITSRHQRCTHERS